ncbi:MAG TPA: hypothetical protein VHD36_16555 [Pirellulales bacterium]|nr:hypothetical protein [Pirellulales bacterium]
MMVRGRFVVLLLASLVGVVLYRHTLWEITSGCGLVFGGVSSARATTDSMVADQLRQLEDSAMLARALVYLDAHPVKPDMVDPQRADEHRQWLADLERQLAQWRSAHAR